MAADPITETPEFTHQAFLRLCGEGWRFALGWNEDEFLWRLYEIYRFAIFNSKVVSLDQRRRIARLASKLLSELNGLGGLPEGFLDTLHALAGPKGERRTASQSRPSPGGDRRSGERTLRSSVLGMIVRLYCEAHEEPTFSDGGPLVRFANSVGRWALGVEGDPFTSDAVKAEFRRMKPEVRRPRGLASLYKHMSKG